MTETRLVTPGTCLLGLVLTLVAACTSPPPVREPVETRPGAAVVDARETPREGSARAALPATMGLAQCVRVALARHARGSIADAGIDQARAQLEQANSASWPRVTLSSKVMRLHEDPYFVFPAQPIDFGAGTEALANAIALSELVNAGIAPQPGNPMFDAAYDQAKREALKGLKSNDIPAIDVDLADRDSWATSVDLVYPLFTGGKITAFQDLAKVGVKAAQSQKVQALHQTAFEVARMYHAVLLSRELMKVGREALLRFEVILDITERVYKTGSGTVDKTDYLKTKVFKATVEGHVRILERGHEQALAGLHNAMGLDPSESFEIADDSSAILAREVDSERLLVDAFAERPEWKQIQLGIEAAGRRVDAARSGHWPSIAAFASISHLENSLDGGINDFAENSWAIGVGLEVPLFEGFATSAAVRKAKAERCAAVHLRRVVEQGIRTQIQVEASRLKAAQENLETARRSLKDAQENRELNLRAYEAELAETQDMLEAQLLETMTKARYHAAVHACAMAHARIGLATGTILRILETGR
jgi:outer membrane protein